MSAARLSPHPVAGVFTLRMDTVIETRGLRKVYRNRKGTQVAVDGLDLSVPAGGGVHGFLGPNGSGKTTTIRLLLGLSRPSGGTMSLFGRSVPEALPQVMPRVGAVVESPKFSPRFTGRQNLLLLSTAMGVAESRVDAALDTVGLTGRDRDRYQGYSLGMKQRLAIAATLLRDPDLLILDEPTNGLDPAGIREIRETIRGLGERGVTVLLSSHLLAEVEQVCTAATIIGRGRVLASGAVDTLLGDADRHRVRVADPGRAAQVLRSAGLSVTEPPGDDPDAGSLLVACADPARITRALGEADLWLHELTPHRADLESVFLRLTGTDASTGAEEVA